MVRLAREHVVHRAAPRDPEIYGETDPVIVEVIRHGLNSAANQMKRALVRTAFSPVIYEVLDFAVAIYDPEMRLLAQAPSLPMFMGTMNFCVEAAVRAVGGAATLRPGDIILYNEPYGTGSHPQDAALVMPVFHDGTLVAYTAIKGHWLDIGGKEPYSTDTVDVFQEGTIFPGIRLFEPASGSTTCIGWCSRTAVCRRWSPAISTPRWSACARARARCSASSRATASSSSGRRWRGCTTTARRSCALTSRQLPDGIFIGRGEMDSNGITEDPLPFEVIMEIAGSSVRLDFTRAPDAQAGPVNCPVPSTMSASRIAISMLAGNGEAPNEGHFRAIEVVTRPGSMFHPLPPSPCFLYGWPAMQAIEAIYQAVRTGDAGSRHGLQRWRHLLAGLVGQPRGDRRAVGRRFAASGRSGSARPWRRRQ